MATGSEISAVFCGRRRFGRMKKIPIAPTKAEAARRWRLPKSVGHETWFYWYVTAMCAIALIVSIVMPDPSKKGYLVNAP